WRQSHGQVRAADAEAGTGHRCLRDGDAGATGVGHGLWQELAISHLNAAETEARRACGQRSRGDGGPGDGDVEASVGSVAGNRNVAAGTSAGLWREGHVESRTL